ncbi:MAG: hypothetical protein GXP54_13060 [Deltaproteobacteria bacterium]|nr:hypothetical protein [Deltaproteobacteria bacterium]
MLGICRTGGRLALALTAIAGLMCASSDARAGGVAGLFGPTGIQSGFAVDEAKDFTTLWRVDLSGGIYNSRLKFGGQGLDTFQYGLVALAEVYPVERFGIHFGLGALIAGNLTDGNVTHKMDPGIIGAFGLTVAALRETKDNPFILLGGDFMVEWVRTKADTPGAGKVGYTALDGRLSLIIGKTLPQNIVLYVKAQGLLGRVYWEMGGKSVDGDDDYHYSAGFGLWANLPYGMKFFLEAMPAGERTVSIGYGASF